MCVCFKFSILYIVSGLAYTILFLSCLFLQYYAKRLARKNVSEMTLTQSFNQQHNSPQSISIIQPHQHHVCSELRLTRAQHVLPGAQITVHLLQRLQTLRQVLIVDLRVEDGHVFLAQRLRAQDVKPRALLDKTDRRQVTQLLLSDVLSYHTPRNIPPPRHIDVSTANALLS